MNAKFTNFCIEQYTTVLMIVFFFFLLPPSAALKRPRRLESPFAAATQLSHIVRQEVKGTLPWLKAPARYIEVDDEEEEEEDEEDEEEDEEDEVFVELEEPNFSLKVFRRQSSSSSQ